MTMKVVSLLPSATEILAASSPSLDDDDLLIGRSHECDYPKYVTTRPVLTAAKNKFESCAQMNEAVCTSLAAGEGLYSLDTDLLKELDPDVIITQDLCNVCSVDLNLVEKTCKNFSKSTQIISLNPFTLEDVLHDIRKVGQAVGRARHADEVASQLRKRIQTASRIGDLEAQRRSKPLKVTVLEWFEPIFPGGHWTPQLVKLAGAAHPLNPPRWVAGPFMPLNC